MALSFTLEGFMAGLCETATHLGQLLLAKNESQHLPRERQVFSKHFSNSKLRLA